MLLGYTQHRALPILQASRICGVYGVSFLLVAANAGIVGLIVRGRPGWRVAAVPGLLLLAALGYGYYRLGLVPHGPEVRIGIVQGSIRQDVKWQVDFRNGTLDRYEDLTRRLSGAGTEFIVLPETALPFHFNHAENAVHRDRAVGLVREMKVPMLIGSLERTGERTYNRAFLVSARGETVGHQDKVHLVPFGEYLPMEWLFGYLEGLTRESGRFAPGDDHRVLRLPGRGIPFGVFVCYESIFPEIARAYAGQGAEFLVNVTNDAWFGITSAPYQHLAMGVFRAVENGLPLIRAANTGISGAVDASGRILAATPLFEPLSLAIRITASRERTFYTRHGDLLVLLCAVSTAWLLYSAFRDRS
jgi:apolipoprotein N-acyltransferase